MSKDAAEAGSKPGTGVPDLVGSGLRIKGEVSGDEDLLVEGTVEGPIHLANCTLTVGLTGKLTSDIIARQIIVHGSVRGNLRATERIEITKNGSVIGDIRTTHIFIEDGASVKGWVEIDREAANAPEIRVRAQAATASNSDAPGPAN